MGNGEGGIRSLKCLKCLKLFSFARHFDILKGDGAGRKDEHRTFNAQLSTSNDLLKRG